LSEEKGMNKLKKYLEKKRLELNMRKMKIMKCRRKNERIKKMGKCKMMEEVKKFNYLRYTL